MEALDKEKFVMVETFLEEEISKPEKKFQKFVCVGIMDTGKGMPGNALESIGEPYFTTKRKGTGLGIFIAKQLLKEQHAEMRIESEEGKGTKVIIRFKIF